MLTQLVEFWKQSTNFKFEQWNTKQSLKNSYTRTSIKWERKKYSIAEEGNR